MSISGKCPKGARQWLSFESRCYYRLKSDRKYLSAAMSTCSAQGAWLSRQASTKDQRDFLVLNLRDHRSIHVYNGVFTGITDAGFEHRLHGYTFRVKLCDKNTSLLYRVRRNAPSPDCTAPNLYSCELRKGNSVFDL